MTWTLKHRRDDGTFVIILNGYPYHVVQNDPLFADVAAASEGADLEPEMSPTPTPPAQPSVPQDVSMWQFMTAAWKMSFITQAEALAAVKDKVMPPAFAAALAGLPDENQAEAQLKFAGITRMVRADPLFALVVAANIATDAQIDGVFTLADSIT